MPDAATLPLGIAFTNDQGDVGVLSGKVEILKFPNMPTSSWVQRTHPLRSLWIADELRQRASFLATRHHLAPFLVPHRFEGKEAPRQLNRARFAYGVGLNKAYLHEIFGHIRGAPIHYTWGPLGATTDQDIIVPPTGGQAKTLWWDATGDGVSWTNFFEGRVLEWILTSVGGFVLVDSNRPTGVEMTQATAERLGIRARMRWIPMSWVEDFSRGPNGYRWIKIAETADVRRPREEKQDKGFERRHILYELLPDGTTMIERFDDDGKRIGAPIFQRVFDEHGRGILPLIEAKFGEHPDVPHLGSGLLMGLDDIVIDLFNLLTELREAFRDAAFGFLAYRGPDSEAAHRQVEEGSRWVDIGDDPNASLERVAADGSEVAAGIPLFDIGLKNWSLSAKRRAMEIMEASSARSGVSLKAEFQLDLRPLLVAVCEALDLIETNSMFVLAQIEGASVQEASQMVVKRETEFQLEQEASRIARIVGEFLQAIPAMPKSLLKRMIMRWAESIDFLKLEEPAGEGQTGTLKEVIDREATEIADSEQKAVVQRNEMMGQPGFGGGGGLGGGGGGEE